VESPSPRRLPTFRYRGKTWTVDELLREFRFMILGKVPEFVPFDSKKGAQLLLAYWKNNPIQEGEL
jgi:hypothetical protein